MNCSHVVPLSVPDFKTKINPKPRVSRLSIVSYNDLQNRFLELSYF